MRREQAEEISASLRDSDAACAHLDQAIRKFDDEPERKRLLRARLDLIVDTYDRITREVTAQYPDLDPDGADKKQRPDQP